MTQSATFTGGAPPAGTAELENQIGPAQQNLGNALQNQQAQGQPGQQLRELGKSLDPKEQAALVIGGLINNIQEGTDNAIQSLKALGNTRDFGMFQQEMQTGVVIINVPQSAIDRKAEILNAAEEDQ
jgi:hypothetical protein